MAQKMQSRKASSNQRVRAIPSGYHAVTPYLSVRGAALAIDFYKEAFGATEVMRMPGPDGKLGHVELQIGDSRLMLSDERDELPFLGPQSRGGTTVHLHLYVEDVDSVVRRAVAAGAKELRPVQQQFYGDRTGTLEDPFGHVWHVATHVEDVPLATLKKKAAELAAQASRRPLPQASA